MAKKILVIEDVFDTLNTIVDLLEYEGYQTIGAKNGLIGLQLAKAQLPDLVISDINMPQKSGFDVLCGLRQYPPTSKIPVILMSGDDINFELAQNLNFLADDYLLKPIIARKLIEVVTAQLRKKQTTGELVP